MSWGTPVEEENKPKTSSWGTPVEGDIPKDPSLFETATNVVNDVNRGILGVVPGLTHYTSKIGLWVDRTPGETSIGEAAANTAGMAIATGPMMMAGAMKNLAAPVADQLLMRSAAAAEGASGGVVASVKSFLDNTAKTAVENSGKFWGLEAASGATAGAGGQALEDAYGTPEAKAVGEIIGGSVPGLVPATVSAAKNLSLVSWGVRGVNWVRNKLFASPEAQDARLLEVGQDRARERLYQASSDPIQALDDAQMSKGEFLDNAPLTTIEKSGDTGLLSLEVSVRKATEELAREEQDRFTELNQVIRREFEDVEEGLGTMDDARAYLQSLVDARIQTAGAVVNDRIAKATSPIGREDASKMARAELDKAYDDALAQEKQLWDKVDSTLSVNLNKTLDGYEELMLSMGNDRVSASRLSRDIPQVVKKFLGKYDDQGNFTPGSLGGTVSAGEAKQLRSELLDAARRERMAKVPNRRKLKVLADLQGALLDDLSIVQGDDSLSMARAFSADLNTRFREGDVGDILGFSSSTELPEGLTLQKTLGKSRLAGAEALDSLLNAAPELKEHAGNYLLDEFMTAATKRGDFNAAAANNYIASRADVLDRLPDIKKKMERALKSQKGLDAVKASAEGKKSASAIVLNSPLDKEINRLRNSVDVQKQSRELFKTLQADPKALKGFKQGLLDDIMDRSQLGLSDDAGESLISGRKLGQALNDPATSKMLKEFLSPDQLKKLKRIQGTAVAAERSRTAQANVGDIINDNESLLFETTRQVMGAAAGRRFGQAVGSGGTVQIPGIFVKAYNKLYDSSLDPARDLISKAILAEDDKLLRAILKPSSVSPEFLSKQLNAWAYGAAAEYGFSLTEEE